MAYEVALSSRILDDWCIDSGATAHICNRREFFKTLDQDYSGAIEGINGDPVKIQGKGSGILLCPVGNVINEITIHDVLFVPGARSNLISVSKLADKGLELRIKGLNCTVHRDDEMYFEAIKTNGIYKLSLLEEQETANAVQVQEEADSTNPAHVQEQISELTLLHRRFGHRDVQAILDLQRRNLATGIKVNPNEGTSIPRCVECVTEKGIRPSFHPISEKRSSKVLDLIHTDLCGPLKVKSLGNNRYILIFVDDFSRYCVTYLLKEKSEVHEHIKKYLTMVSNRFERKPKAIQSDNGGEYVSHDTQRLLEEQGISHYRTVSHTPEQNGVSERKLRSLLEMTRSMLADAELPHNLWGHAVVTATYLQNRLPTKGANKTPFEIFHGRVPNVAHIRVFGSIAYSYVPKQKRSKLDSRAEPTILVGFESNSKAYKVLNLRTGEVNTRHVVHFDEEKKINKRGTILDRSKNQDQYDGPLLDTVTPVLSQPKAEGEKDNDMPNEEITPTEGDAVEDADESADEATELEQAPVQSKAHVPTEIPEVRRSSRPNKGVPPPYLSYSARMLQTAEPATWEEVEQMPAPEGAKWRQAAAEEIEALHKNGTWTLTKLPQGKKSISSKWIFKEKRNANGEVERYKGRLVARGFLQKYGEDFDETFAPVVTHPTIRLLLSIAASRQMQVKHLDVKTAFLHGEISEELYMSQPPGFVDQEHPDYVCKLNKGLYGLKQAARAWNEKLKKMLIQQGFKQAKADPCLYTRNKDGHFSFILAYVDDLILATHQKAEYEEIVHKLSQEVEIKELGNATFYLGIQIEREADGSYLLNQKQKIDELIHTLGMQDAHPVATPMQTDFLKDREDSEPLPDNHQYRTAIGKLLYLTTVSRPDIATAVGILSRKVSLPTQKDWTAVKRIVRYLKGTTNFKLRLPACREPQLIVYTDADWAESTDYRSTSGFLFMYGDGPISWASRKQDIAALSSTESEFIAASEACRELLWLNDLLEDLAIKREKPFQMMEDNQSCIKLSQSERMNARTKHIGVRHRFVNDLTQKGLVQMTYCPTAEMTADVLTKPLPRDRFQNLRRKMGLVDNNAC